MRMTTPITEVRMRGDEREDQKAMWSYVPMERRIPADHPLRAMRPLVDALLRELSPRFDELYSNFGRPSIAPEKLLRALLLQVLYTIRSERLLMEQLDYNLLFRWFVGLEMDDPVWNATVFTKNRERLLRAVDGEVLVRQQPAFARLGHDSLEEGPCDLAAQQALPILGEHGGVPDRIVHLQAHEPPEQQVIVQLLHQQPLAPDRVQHLQQQGTQQLLGGNRGPANNRVELVEPRREFAQEGIDQRPHRAQRVISWDTPLHRYVAPHRLLVFPLVAAHAHLRDGSRHAHRSRTLMSTRYLKSGFSAAC